mmetsp:Transcript_1849/g.4110  ORF Transcript_1849/g.4110 Transcript_1849/m.4110 type:complete len:217 (-) Transcript_1849:302-952(-)
MIDEAREISRGATSPAPPAGDLGLHHGEAYLAILDALDPDLDLLTALHDVVDIVDKAVFEAGDVHKPLHLCTEVDERAEGGGVDDGSRVLLAHLQLVQGDRWVLHILSGHGRGLWPAVGVIPLHLEGAILVELGHNTWVHVPVLREHGLHSLVHLVILVDDDHLHVPHLDWGDLGAAVGVVPLHVTSAVCVDLLNGGGVPVLIVFTDGLHPVALRK